MLDDLNPGKRLYLFSTGPGRAPFMSIIRDPETYEKFDIDSDYSFFGLDKPLPKNQLHQNQEINFKLPSNDIIAERCRTILDDLQDNQVN